MRLSTSDASFLYMESASGPMHISSVVVIDGALKFEDVFAHFEARIHLLPAYRRKLAQVPFNIAHPSWVDDPDFDLANHVTHEPMPEGTDLDEAIAYAVKLNEPMLDRSKPLWNFRVITGVPDMTVILQATHHCMIDGASGIELQAIIYDFDPKGDPVEAPKQPWEPGSVPGPVDVFNEALNEKMAQLAQTDWTAVMRPPEGDNQRLMQRAGQVMQNFLTRPAMTTPFNAGLVGPQRKLSWIKLSFDEIREVRRALGGTINDVVLAMATESIARYLEEQGEQTTDQYLRIMCPVNVRTENQKGALGNQVSAIFPVLPAWPMNPLQRLAAVSVETDRIKTNQDAQALTLMQESAVEPWPVALWPSQLVGTPMDPTQSAAMFPMPVMPAGMRPPMMGYNFTCTNVPGSQVPQYLCGRPIRDQIGLLVLTGNVGFSLTILSYNKTLFFGFICEPRLLPDIERISEGAEQVFNELLDAARTRAASMAS